MPSHRVPSLWLASRVPAAVVAVVLSLTAAPSEASGALDQQLELKIRDYKFVKTNVAPLHPGFPAEIVVTNEDNVRHGFTSPFFLGLHVEGEGEGIVSHGKGVDGFYIDPGKSLTIRFIMPQPGRFTFRCDIHKDMEGEIYLLEIPIA